MPALVESFKPDLISGYHLALFRPREVIEVAFLLGALQSRPAASRLRYRLFRVVLGAGGMVDSQGRSDGGGPEGPIKGPTPGNSTFPEFPASKTQFLPSPFVIGISCGQSILPEPRRNTETDLVLDGAGCPSVIRDTTHHILAYFTVWSKNREKISLRSVIRLESPDFAPLRGERPEDHLQKSVHQRWRVHRKRLARMNRGLRWPRRVVEL